MRLQNKYKNFSKIESIFKEFPSKLLKFHRTKWKKTQQIILKKKIDNQIFWSTKILLYTKKWFSYKSRYGISVQLKNYFDCLFDNAFSLLFFKKLKYLNKKLDRVLEHSIYTIKPEFRLDVFLWRLNFFPSCYSARQFINNNQIKINNLNSIHPNYFVKKGDIILFDSNIYHINLNFKNLLLKKINNTKILSFIEIDYYTNTIIILKNYNELTEKDIMFFISNFINISQFKAFIE